MLELRTSPWRLNDKKRYALSSIYLKRFAEKMPDAKCELYHESPFQLLVSVILSAQTTDKMVNLCMEPLYKEGFGVETVLALGADGLLQKIRKIGLAPTKSKNVYKTAQLIQTLHDGLVPENREKLESLPGVGRKTANVVLGEVFGHPTMAVDTHVFRVGKRLGLHKENTADKAEKAILRFVDKSLLPQAHHWFILHGRYVCKAQKPDCASCYLKDICPSLVENKSTIEKAAFC